MLLELAQPDKLAEDLEKGLGEIHWLTKAFEPSLRLRMEGVCGITSIAIAEHFKRQGHEVDLVISDPKLDLDQGMRHVMPIVRVDGHEATIDANYSSFLTYAGLTPGYVMFNQFDYFPESKIEIIRDGKNEALVRKMSEAALRFMPHFQYMEEMNLRIPQFMEPDVDESVVNATYAAIWDPAYFDTYRPSEETLAAGKRLAEYVMPEHVRLIA